MSVTLQVIPASGHLPILSWPVVGLCMLHWFVSWFSSLCLVCQPVRMSLLWPLLRLISPVLSLATQWLSSGVESQFSSGAELRRISSRQTVWTWHLFVTHRRILKGSKTQSGSLLSEFAHIWVASPYQMLVILVGGFAPAMVPIMMSLAGFERGQHLTIWRYPLTLSWMRTNYLLVKKQWDLFRSIVAIPNLSVFFPQPKKIKNKK